jgi:hypothetical protein
MCRAARTLQRGTGRQDIHPAAVIIQITLSVRGSKQTSTVAQQTLFLRIATVQVLTTVPQEKRPKQNIQQSCCLSHSPSG